MGPGSHGRRGLASYYRVSREKNFEAGTPGPRFSPVGAVELASAGDGISDASAADGVRGLHNDKGSLLQRGHREVLCVIHWLQEAAIAGPQRVL